MHKTIQDYWASLKKQAENRLNRGIPEYPTGLKFIDDLTDGIHKGQVWTIAGRSSSGKTSLALQIARNIADRPTNSVLFISLEMTGEQLVERMFCEMMREDNGRIVQGYLDKNKSKAFEKYLGSIDFEISENGYNFQELLKIIKDRYVTKKPDLIIIDFAQLIETKTDQRVDMENYIRKLTELAKVDNVAIILVSQFRRPPSGANMNREPEMEDMKGTGILEQMSHCVLIIYKYIENELEHYILKLAKNRSGPRGSQEVRFIGTEYRFKEIL